MNIKKIISVSIVAALLLSNSAFAYADELTDTQTLDTLVDSQTLDEQADDNAVASLYASIFEGGDGTEENPFLIATADQLAILNDLPSSHFKLVSDVELEGDWMPIGNNGDNFTGTLDGNGYAVKNLNVSAYNYDAGLFGYNEGTIKNLRVEVKEDGKVYSGTSEAGIIAGGNNGTISGCCSFGAVCGGNYTGGLVGYNKSDGIIENCYFKGNVSGYDRGGGIGYNNGTVKNCYAVAVVSGNSYCKGFCYANSGTITSCYYDKQVSGVSDTGNGEPKTTLGMKLTNTYTGWDFENVWGIDSNINDGYPYLLIEKGAGSVTGITLNQSSATMAVGETLKLTAELEQTTDTERSITWESSDNAVATVKDGLVTAKAIGSATITASVGAVKAECTVTVADNAVKVTGIVLDKSSLDLVIGESTTLKATVLPDDATNKSVTWQNLNSDIVSFNQSTGEIKALAVGTARIRATTADGGMTADCVINVYDDTVKVVSVALDKNATGIGIGETVTLKATVLPENASNKSIKWSSLNSNVATVTDSGVVTGISEGTTQIYATSTSNSACYAICRVTVAKNKVAVTGIELDSNVFGDAFEVDIGKTLIFNPTIKPNNATNKDIKWTSSDNSVAKVENGVVTGLAAGTATITATTVDGGFSAKTTVKVCEPIVYVSGIVVNKEQLTVPVKSTVQLLASVIPTMATDKTIKFESNNNAIATVSQDGVITGVSQGTTLIKAISETASGRYVAFCTVTVPKPVVEVTSIKLDKSSIEIVEGKTVPVKAVIKPTNATYKNVTWSAGDESIATVSQDGYITARGVGQTVVSATTENGKTALCDVTVLSVDTPAQLKVEDATVKSGKQVPITVSIAANPGISSFMFSLKYDNTKLYPVSYTLGDVLNGIQITTPLGTTSFKDKTQVSFLCMTSETKNIDTDGDLIKVLFQTLPDVEMGDVEIEIIPSSFINQNGDEMNLLQDNCTLSITDYIIGDVNNDDKIDLKDSMLLAQYISGFDVTLTPQGLKAATAIYPDSSTAPTLNDLQHLFRYLSDWQVELGKK